MCVGMLGYSQIQHGYVKTLGRLANGEVVPGKVVSGVTIQVKQSNAIISGEDGTFSFPMPDKTYMLQRVQKKGFVLTDPDILSHQYTYSVNPLVILMADQAEQNAYRRAIEKSVRDKLYSDLEKRVAELEKQLEQKKITEEQYRELLNKIDNDYNNNEKIVKDMADRYVRIDFDSVDDFNRKISDCILNGRLTEADSLLETKGNIGKRVKELEQLSNANAAMHQKLELSEAMESKERNELAEDCFHKFTIHQMSNQHDSAAYYIELRADLDPACVNWQSDAGDFLFHYLNDYEGAKKYYQRNIDTHLAMGEGAKLDLAEDYTRIGEIYYVQRQSLKAIEYCEEALSIRLELLGENHPLTAESYNNLGLLKDPSLIYKAIKIVENLPGDTIPELAQYYENLAFLTLIRNQYYDRAMIYYLLPALDICKKYYGEESLRTADSYCSIGDLYYRQSQSVLARWWRDCPCALDAYHNALSIYEKAYGPNHLKVADVHLKMGRTLLELAQGNRNSDNVSIAKGYYALAEDEANHAIKLYQAHESKYGTAPEMMSTANDVLTQIQDDLSEEDNESGWVWADDPLQDKVNCYYDLGISHYDCGNNRQALNCFNTALKIYTEQNEETSFFMSDVYYRMGCVYFYEGDTIQAQTCFDKSISLCEEQADFFKLERIYYSLGELYDVNDKYDQAAECFRKIISQRFFNYSDYYLRTSVFERLAEVYEHQGQYDQALACCDSVPVHNVWKDPTTTLRYYNKKSEIYALKNDEDSALKCYDLALSELTDPQLKAIIHDNLGLLYCKFGHPEEAEKHLKIAFKIRDEADYQNEAEKIRTMAQSHLAYGRYYTCQNDSTQAIESFREAYGIHHMYSGKRSIALATCCEYAGEMYAHFSNYPAAIECYEEAYIIVLNEKGVYHKETISFRKRLDELKEESKQNQPPQ